MYRFDRICRAMPTKLAGFIHARITISIALVSTCYLSVSHLVCHDHVSSSANCRKANVLSGSCKGSVLSPYSCFSSAQACRVAGSFAQSMKLKVDRSFPFGPYLTYDISKWFNLTKRQGLQHTLSEQVAALPRGSWRSPEVEATPSQTRTPELAITWRK